MGVIHDLARRLGRALKESPENQSFQAALKKVQADRKAEAMLANLRKGQMEVAAMQMQGKKPAAEQVKALEKLVQEVQSYPAAHEYLQAETRLSQLWADVQKVMAEGFGAQAPGGRR